MKGKKALLSVYDKTGIVELATELASMGWELFSPEILGGKTVAETLLEPTRLYVKTALAAARSGMVRGMAHITGGGLYDNVRRIVPAGLSLSVDFGSWPRPAVFGLLQERGIPEEEMRKVFNLGIGFVFIVPGEEEKAMLSLLEGLGEKGRTIGKVGA